jgi:hypothetical protein
LVFATGCFTFNYRQRYARKDSSVLTPALLVPDPLLSICRSEIQITSISLLLLQKVRENKKRAVTSPIAQKTTDLYVVFVIIDIEMSD